MTPFIRINREAALAMVQRNELLAHPCEFFRDFFGGRIPTLPEKLFWIEEAVARMTAQQVFENDTYTVSIDHAAPFIHLTITRHDGVPVKEWSHLQRIKNELVGPEHEAVELFPAESRLVDAVNQYHLWVHADARYRFPLGFQARRFVLDKPLKAGGTDSTFASPSPVMSPAFAH